MKRTAARSGAAIAIVAVTVGLSRVQFLAEQQQCGEQDVRHRKRNHLVDRAEASIESGGADRRRRP